MNIQDVIIVGGGIAGLTAALALVQATSLRVAVIDAEPVKAVSLVASPQRVIAISLASMRVFQQLGVWPVLQKQISAYKKMHVWDAAGTGVIDFDCRDISRDALGYIIENDAIVASLLEKLSHYPQAEIHQGVTFTSLQQQQLITAEGEIFSAKLIIAADGAHSFVREQLGVPVTCKEYSSTALVATVTTEQAHQSTAWQRFLPTGPLAFLPLADQHMCSIVWSVATGEANKLLSLNDEAFKQALATAFEQRLGKITNVSPRQHFPLVMRHIKQYVLPGVAFIGDAAHTVHPLAGQGGNLSMYDAIYLVRVIVDALVKKRDYASYAQLRRYERAQKSNNAIMLAMMNHFKNIFGSERKSIAFLRNTGLSIANGTPWLKNYFMQYALGDFIESGIITVLP